MGDGGRHMHSLNLAQNNLVGDISELSKLNKLENLNLDDCEQLTGEITGPTIRWLSGIKEKNLKGCGKLTLASDLSDIADMTHVDLSNMNSLTGDISSLSKLDTLENLNLEYCEKLTGDISEISKLDKLEKLDLRWCHELTGGIS